MKKLNVYLDGEQCGTFEEKNGQIAFTYSPGYKSVVPLSLSMSERSRTHKNKVALPFLRGLLPDNTQALENMARAAGVSPGSIFGLLERYGQDVAGALQLLPPGKGSSDAQRANLSQQPVLNETDFEKLLEESRELYHGKTLITSDAFRFSVAGAQPKLSLTRNSEGKWVQPGTGIATTHIIKPVKTDDDYFVKNIDITEFLTMKAAVECGLNAVDPELWRSEKSSLTAVIVPRYDRYILDDAIHRVHQEDLLQALGVPPEKKYQHRDGGPGVGEIGQLFRQKTKPEDRSRLQEEFFKGLVFNVGVVGTDAHAKNYSLVHRENGSEFAPLYDLISAAAHIDDEKHAFFPMAINKKYKFTKISDEDLVVEGQRLGLSKRRSQGLVKEILGQLPEAFQKVGKEYGLEDSVAKILDGLERLSVARFVTDYWR
ncbi:MAG: HipA domain-containing protein [Rothia sp. (in: high G+C Gram-positive bacteria)]|nr:HipA domain-containing protein [Rothia sp. (in: high G+C Gram-positive bacteria)]